MTAQPFRSPVMRVEDAWIDFNGHMNMAFYSVLFDRCADLVYEGFGFGPAYQATGFTTYMAEWHICYLRELHRDAPVTVTLQVLDHDEKSLHTYQEIWHEDGWCAASAEGLSLHIDQSGPRVAPMPDSHLQNVAALYDQHKGLPRPDRAGRQIGIRRKA